MKLKNIMVVKFKEHKYNKLLYRFKDILFYYEIGLELMNWRRLK